MAGTLSNGILLVLLRAGRAAATTPIGELRRSVATIESEVQLWNRETSSHGNNCPLFRQGTARSSKETILGLIQAVLLFRTTGKAYSFGAMMFASAALPQVRGI